MLRTPAIAVLCCASLVAQDPPAPPGGFAMTQLLDHLLGYSDSYQTKGDLRYPSHVPAPATGWPCVMIWHGGSGDRKEVQVRCTSLARAGYMTIAVDRRGAGETPALNGTSDPGTAARQVLDTAELFVLVKNGLGPLMDAARLGLSGLSAGGASTLQAASYSNQTLPLAGYVARMPRIGAMATDIQSLDWLEDMMPGGGTVVSATLADNAYTAGGATHPWLLLMQAGNYPQLHAQLQADVVRNHLARTQAGDVPILAENSWGDLHHVANTTSSALATLAVARPKRFVGSTEGHGTVSNDVEGRLRADLRQRWFDRFLKSSQNGVDLEPFAEIAVPPVDPALNANPASLWPHRFVAVWPPVTPLTRAYLRAGGLLAALPPAALEGPFPILHRVQSGYDVIGFCQDGQRPTIVLPKIPLVTQSFDAPALASDCELWGRAVVELEVTTNVPNVQLTASLWAVPPAGPERFLTLGTAALRSVAAGRHRLRIVLEEIPYVIQAGHRLRLKVQNVAMRFLPTSVHYLSCPEFQDADWTVHADPTFAAYLDLPLRVPEPAFVPRFARASTAAGIDHTMSVRAGAARAGRSYVVCLGASGVAPGVSLGAQQVWLNPDAWTSFGLGVLNTPTFQSFLGTLDANGEANARFFVPGLPFGAQLAGKRFELVTLLLPGPSPFLAITPATLAIDP